MIDPVLMIVFIALAFILGLTLGAGAIEYDRVEKEVAERREEIEDK